MSITENLRVKWEPALDIMLIKTIDSLDVTVPNIRDLTLEPTVMPKNYVDLELNTTINELSKNSGPIFRIKRRLKLDNGKLLLMNPIESFTRSSKQPYKEVWYK